MGIAVALGSTITAGYLTGTAAGVLGGAIIGAAVGGLTSAVMGGDIGKGVLFGAIGGAVMGGISGAMATTTATSTTTTATTTTAGVGGSSSGTLTVGMGSQGTTGALGGGVQVTTKGIGSTLVTETTKAGLLENTGAYLGVNALTEGVKGYLANKAADKQAEALSEQSELQRQHEKELLQMRIDAAEAGGGASGGDELAYKARMSELEQRRKEFERTMGLQEDQWGETKKATAARKALFEGVGRDRGATVDSDNTVAEVGIFDKLEEKPVSALKTERALA